MTKIGRNEHCPCGSGFNYKHCCGALTEFQRRSPVHPGFNELPGSVQKKNIEFQRAATENRAAYGHARPMVTLEHLGYRLIAPLAE